MALPDRNDVFEFCGFANGSSFRTKYFLDESTMTITPCAELLLISVQTIPLFFFTLINYSLLRRFYPRFESPAIPRIFIFRSFVSFVSAAVLVFSIVFTAFGGKGFEIKSAFQIEYGLMALTWLAYAFLWVFSVFEQSWTRSRELVVSAFFASKVYYLILANRWILYGFLNPRTIIIAVLAVFQTINSVNGFIEWRIHKRSQFFSHVAFPLEVDETVHLDDLADEQASIFSRIFFLWTNQLVKKGGRKQLNALDDVFKLPPSLQVGTVERAMVENSPTFYSDGTPYSIAKSLLATFGVQFFSLAVLRLASDAFTFAGPILLHLLVQTFDSPLPTNDSYTYAGLMIVCSLAAALFSANFNYYVQKISFKVRAATITAVYDKLTCVPLAEMRGVSSGKMMNFYLDGRRFLPVQLCVALYLLHREVGMAFISGLVAAILLIPINKVITNYIGKMSERLMNCKDLRIRMIKETMEGIKSDQNLRYLKIRKYLDAVCVYLWASAPLLITISILATYTLVLHEKLTSAKVFTSLALVNILIMPLNAFPWVLNGLVEALVSIKRLEWFFALRNIDMNDIYSQASDEKTLLSVIEGRQEGQIIGITGQVGSGKSTLLQGILGETKYLIEAMKIRQTSISQGFGYVGQERWLWRGTIRENILAGKRFEPARYEEVLRDSCLISDIQLMPGGDAYEISDNGSSLSGGQRTRVALARALYQDNSVYLFDEPFASLDRKVADSIWKNVMEKLRDKGKLIVVASHEKRLLARANYMIVLDFDGRVKLRGAAADVLRGHGDDLHEDISFVDERDSMENVLVPEEEKQSGAVRVSVYKAYGVATGVAMSVLIISALVAMQATKNGADWWLSKWTESQGPNASANFPKDFNGVWLAGRRYYEMLGDEEMDRSVRFLCIYAAIAGANTIFTLIRAFLFAYGGIIAARYLHESLLHKLMKAPLSWWDRTPAGRVINRLCSDVYTVDDNLPFQLNIFLASLFNLIGSLVITLLGLPFLAPVVILLFVVYFFIQNYYRLTTVELKRLSTLTLSPLYSLLSDTVNGLVTIRAQRLTDRFAGKLRERLTNNLRAQFSSLAASQWLSIRLSMIAVAVVSAITVAAIIQHRVTHVDSGLVALAITYALSMTSLLNGLLGSFIETEKEMVSVERIDEYLQTVEEEKSRNDKFIDPTTVRGKIVFKNVSLRYKSNLPLALDNISLSFESGRRVAIIGRTGSGKSSIFQALLQLAPIENGTILLDDVDIRTYDKFAFRRCFGVIPQMPFIFSGTLYDNLTVNGGITNRAQVTQVVRVANLDSVLTRIGGLDGEIIEDGKNLSVGEKQLISVCRILLCKPKIVLIDEATSNMDRQTHLAVYSLLRAHLPMATILCILHSPDSSENFDGVIELDRGSVARLFSAYHNTIPGH
ncbi:unnamed protein product [Caenorhabditis auriculariae]|uniref:Uncharacterized protein n=1 Tax=Caenorhabditis auriculariae TaxID=2777116 RepID=A0A8S1HK83_9PELO|nr:unnamed protein product [Caenorhabditis auriculariae]